MFQMIRNIHLFAKSLNYSWSNCDIMGQNQSHMAEYERVEIDILSENVKESQFPVLIKTKLFLLASVTLNDFCIFLLDFQ